MIRRMVEQTFVLLNVDHVRLDGKWNYRNVISPYYRLYYIDEGEGRISAAKASWVLEPGYLYLIPSFTLCSLHCPTWLGQYFIHFFEDAASGLSLFHNNRTVHKIKADAMDIANCKRLLAINPSRKINRSDNPTVYEKTLYYREYEEGNNRLSYAGFLETQGILLQLMAKFLASGQLERGDSIGLPPKVVGLLEYIQLNMGQPLTVKQLAEKANLHPDHLSRLFIQLTGKRPLLYMHTKRIERAQYLMVTTGMSFAQIAEATGFGNVPHFTRVFKKVTSLTPGKYRDHHHQGALL